MENKMPVHAHALIPTTTNIFQASYNLEWDEPFNQATFFNYDSTAPVYINEIPLPPAIVVGGFSYPTSFQINLNENEVNSRNFRIDFKGAANGNLVIVYTQYKGIGL